MNDTHKHVQEILYRGRSIATVVDTCQQRNTRTFYSAESDSLQVGVHQHPKGIQTQRHYHALKKTQIKSLQEVIYVVTGKIIVTFYTRKGIEIKSIVVSEKSLVIIRSVAHAVTMVNDATFIEVKQGPYPQQVTKIV